MQDLNALIQAKNFAGEFSDEDLENELFTCQTYFDKIQSCLPLLETTVSVDSSHSTDVARSLLKQPTAPLPKFLSKEGEDFLKFIAEFESTTSGFEYPDRDLLLLLKQQVEGRGKCLLDSVEADKLKYKDAKDLLLSAFASVELRKYSAVKKLTELSLSDRDDPFIFISNLRTLLVSVQTLDINAEEFMKYFAWNGLNEILKRTLYKLLIRHILLCKISWITILLHVKGMKDKKLLAVLKRIKSLGKRNILKVLAKKKLRILRSRLRWRIINLLVNFVLRMALQQVIIVIITVVSFQRLLQRLRY